jgi:hypothetical protein
MLKVTTAFKEGAEHMIHGLLGSHTAHRQRITPPSDHRIGRGIGEKVGGAPLGFAAADLVVMRLIHGAMVGERDQIHRHSAPKFPQALGNLLGQEVIEMAFERIKVAELAGQGAQHGRPRQGTFKVYKTGAPFSTTEFRDHPCE